MRILIVDDDAHLLSVMARYLQGQGYEVAKASTALEAMTQAKAQPPDVVFLDLFLPDQNGLLTLEQIRATAPRASVVMMSGGHTTRTSVSAIRMGADDCLDKPFPLEEMKRAIEKVSQALVPGDRPPFYLKEYLFIRDVAMSDVYERITQVAKADGVTVLVLGEAGTGKHHAARLIHHLSDHPKAPFAELSCSNLSGEQMEAELFGREADFPSPGSTAQKGLMESTPGGTLFLDEVAEMPLGLQAKLLRVLENRRFRRLGGTQDRPVRFRLVASTHKDLAAESKAGRFRTDLFYRLNLVSIKLPPLRSREEALRSLVRFFADEVCESYGRPRVDFGPEVFAAFTAYAWPGNIRELKNVVSRMVLSTTERDLRSLHLPEEFRTQPLGKNAGVPKALPIGTPGVGVTRFEEVERDAIVRALEANQWNRTRAAEALGISRRTIINKIHKWSLAPESVPKGT